MIFEKKEDTEVRCIKMPDWYVILMPIWDDPNQIFDAEYYKGGLRKLTFKVSNTYRISRVKEIEQEDKEAKMEKGERKVALQEVQEYLKLSRKLDKIEEKKKNLIKR